MHTITRFLAITLLPLLLISCSAKPSIEDIEPHIRSHFEFALEQGIFEIKNMQFIDGDHAAADTYNAKIEFDIVFIKSRQELVKQARRKGAGTAVETFRRNEELFNLMTTFGKFEANSTVHVKAIVSMIEKEDVWIATLISIFVQ